MHKAYGTHCIVRGSETHFVDNLVLLSYKL